MDRDLVAAWVAGYVAAWESNEAQAIGALFGEGARYFTAPYREPWVGRDAIVAGWLGRQDAPGTWSFTYEIDGLAGETAYVRGRTVYHEQPARIYRNLWVIRLDEHGRCEEFVEWWMREE